MNETVEGGFHNLGVVKAYADNVSRPSGRVRQSRKDQDVGPVRRVIQKAISNYAIEVGVCSKGTAERLGELASGASVDIDGAPAWSPYTGNVEVALHVLERLDKLVERLTPRERADEHAGSVEEARSERLSVGS